MMEGESGRGKTEVLPHPSPTRPPALPVLTALAPEPSLLPSSSQKASHFSMVPVAGTPGVLEWKTSSKLREFGPSSPAPKDSLAILELFLHGKLGTRLLELPSISLSLLPAFRLLSAQLLLIKPGKLCLTCTKPRVSSPASDIDPNS